MTISKSTLDSSILLGKLTEKGSTYENDSLFILTSYKNVKMFTGMNLNMLLSVLVEYKSELSDADVENIVNDSRLGVRSLKNDILTDNENF